MKFSVDEMAIMNIYDKSERVKLIIQLQEALEHIEDKEITDISAVLISKLVGMTDEEFSQIDTDMFNFEDTGGNDNV